MGASATSISGTGVSINGNCHTNVSCEDGSKASNKESDGSVWEVSRGGFDAHLLPVNGKAEENTESS
tara:strand:+ start:209 stop:409 length:201 start_codon:yes stop_codon:yes gene_type:complete